MISDFENDVAFNEKLFLWVKEIYEKKDSLNFTVEQLTLINKRYKSFTRNGAQLSEEKKDQLTTFLMNPTISPLSIYYVTINNKENAVKLSEILVQKKLVACVNIIGNNESPINSVFSWKGKQEIDNEILMIMKSRTNLLPEIY